MYSSGNWGKGKKNASVPGLGTAFAKAPIYQEPKTRLLTAV